MRSFALIAIVAVAIAPASDALASTIWQDLFFDDFEAQTVGVQPSGPGVLVAENQDATTRVIDSTPPTVPFAAQPIAGNALRIDDPNTNGGTQSNSATRYEVKLGQNYGVLRADLDVRRLSPGSAVTPFRVVLNGFADLAPTSGGRRPVDVFLKMSGAGVESFSANSPTPTTGVTRPGTASGKQLGFFDGGANTSVLNDETISLSIIANSSFDPFTYEALDGSGSVTIPAKAYHIYTEGSGAPAVGLIPAVPPTPLTLWGNGGASKGPFYFVNRGNSGDTNYYDDATELGGFALSASGDEGPFNFVFDNVRLSTPGVIPEPSTIAIALLACMAAQRGRHRYGGQSRAGDTESITPADGLEGIFAESDLVRGGLAVRG